MINKVTNFLGENILIVLAYLGSVFCVLIGGADKSIKTLLGLMVIDYITGIIKSSKTGKLNSSRGFDGIKRKGTMILIIIATTFADELAGLEGANISFRAIIIFFYIGMEGISIIENAEEIGVPVHSKIKEMFKNFTTKKE